jgi:proteasome lid subunit RPN8/RPN11
VSTEAVSRRVELDEDMPAISVSAEVVHELCRHALEAHPDECCGLVTGTRDEPYRSIHRCTNVMTKMHLNDPEAFPRDASQAYYMNEIEYMKLEEEAERSGEFVSAIYHSHVGAGAYLSEDDLKFAEHVLFPFPDAAQIVLGVSEEGVQAKAIFLSNPETGTFRGHPIEVVK